VSKQVLLIEDDRALARAVARAVEAEGYPAKMVHDGDAGVEELRREAPGLVLLDLLLPKRDGRAVLAWMREREQTRDLPVVIMSGVFKSRDHAQELKEAGAQEFMEKPFRRSDLKTVLQRYLGRPPDKEEAGGGVSLSRRPVAELLWTAMQKGFTGVLEFRADSRLKLVLLEGGRPTFVRSNLEKECLGQRLEAEGVILRAALEESLRRLRSTGKRQGEVLVEMGAITPDQLTECLERQAEGKLQQLFSWTEGVMVEREEVTELTQASEVPQRSPRETVLGGVECMSQTQTEGLLAPFKDLEIARSDIQVESSEAALPGVARLLEALDRPTPLRDLVLDHSQVLYGLKVIGALPLSGGEEVETGEVSADSMAARFEQTKEQTYFEILGVSESASVKDVRKAFLELAKKFHPDRLSAADEPTRRLAADLFARMSEAHDTLSDPEQRKAYLQALKSKTSGNGGAGSTAIVAAEFQFQKGEALFKKRDYAGALERFSSALELHDSEGEFHAYYGWTYFLAHPGDEKAQDIAREHLERAIQLAPRSATGYYFLGLQRKACGDGDHAERMFRKVVEIQPRHVEASRELRLASMRRGKKGQGEGGGLFGFGRKK
jgi:CheY-like chemotaxis protein/tetratricopeptide (TPR) repeat protein